MEGGVGNGVAAGVLGAGNGTGARDCEVCPAAALLPGALDDSRRATGAAARSGIGAVPRALTSERDAPLTGERLAVEPLTTEAVGADPLDM